MLNYVLTECRYKLLSIDGDSVKFGAPEMRAALELMVKLGVLNEAVQQVPQAMNPES